MKDPYYIEILDFKWTMTEKELLNLKFEKGSSIEKVGIFIANDGGYLPLKQVGALAGDRKIRVIGYNRLGERKVAKHYGVKIVSSEKQPPKEITYWYPKAVQSRYPMRRRWTSDPKGLIVHFTAGWSFKESHAEAAMSLGQKNGYTYAAMSKSGKIYQSAPLNHHGYHCGTYHHQDHIGLEICNGGKLDGNFKTWFKKIVSPSRVRTVSDRSGYKNAGHYMTYTKEQEAALIEFCFWLKDTYETFSFDNVLGHDEISRYKNDPGGSLSMSMPEFRDYLKSEYRKRL